MNAKTKLIFAMGGMGKTSFVKSLNKGHQPEERPAVDFDYSGTRKPNSKQIAVAQSHLMNALAKEGVEIITTHHGSLDVDSLDPNLFEVYFFIPKKGEVKTLVERSISRGDDPKSPYVQNYLKEGERWREGNIKAYENFKRRFPNATLTEVDKGDYLTDAIRKLGILN
jgi:GTPase SAR1 family protein